MSQPKAASRLAFWINRYLAHRLALGHCNRGENSVLKALFRHAKQAGFRELDAGCFDTWLSGIQQLHPNTRRKYYQIVRLLCRYRQRREPGCFVPSSEGAAKLRPYVSPVIVEPKQIARTLLAASQLATNK